MTPPDRADFWWSLLAGPRPDPRVLQGVIVVFLALDVVARELGGAAYSVNPWPQVGLLLILIATVGALFVPWQRVPLWALGILPVIDMVGLGMTRMFEGGGLSVLVVLPLPALWLARQFGRSGVMLGLVLVVLFQALPGLVYRGIDGVSISRAVLLTLMSGLGAFALARGLEALRARTREAEERGEERDRALAQLRHQQHLHQAVLDTVDVGLVLLGPEGTIRMQNRQQRDFMALAFPRGQHGPDGGRGDVFGEDGGRRLAMVEMASERAMRGEEFQDHRIRVGADPANCRTLSVSARMLRDAEGAFAGAALVYQDVTDLLRALQVKGEFVATVSHELRTPLTSIIGYVDMLRERDDLPDSAERQLAVVHRNGERLRRLVEELLDTAQLPAGRADLAVSSCDLTDLARQAVAAAQPVAAEAGVSISARLPTRMPARADAARIGQVLENLLSNAVKFNRPGGSVRIELAREGAAAWIEVRDTGPGMSPEELEQLFARFYRTRHAIDHAIPGSGLGLFISKAIVEAHDGRIEVESQVDVGTVVRFRLPMLVGLPGEPGPAAADPMPDPVPDPATPPGIAVGHV